MRKLMVIIVMIGLSIPTSLLAREWTTQQQEFLTFFNSLVDSFAQGPQTYEYWEKQVRPDEELLWWFTHQAMPLDLDSVKRLSPAGNIDHYLYIDIKPIDIKIHGNHYFIFYYNSGAYVDKQGERHVWEDKRLEIYERSKEEWQFLGGMVTPMAERDW